MGRRPNDETVELERVEATGQTKRVADPDAAIARGTRKDLSDEAAQARANAGIEHAAALAHDLKNPLSIITLEADLLEQRLGSHATPAVRSGIERIARNAAYIDRLLSELLDLASLDAGKLEMRLARTDLARLLTDVLARTVGSFDRQRVRLDIRRVLYVRADAARIERVVSNLLTNALKYSHGTPVTVRLDERSGFACVSVIDSGPGLTPEQAESVFERYRRGADPKGEGYGLGLYISRKIIDGHDGKIGITSTPGRGARFYFELPTVE